MSILIFKVKSKHGFVKKLVELSHYVDPNGKNIAM